MNHSKLTTTSYAILGLLAIKPWTTYELAQQVHVRMRRFWPRAESKLYEEPRKLAANGLATAEVGRVGRRRRTVFSGTPAGKRQLAQWLADPGGQPVLEFEALLKVFFAEHGTKADLLATLASVRDWAREQVAQDVETAQRYLEGDGQFSDRAAQLVLVGRFLSDFADMTGRWAQWATEEAEQWPTEVQQALPNWNSLKVIADRKTAW